jgi:hypothetical protein
MGATVIAPQSHIPAFRAGAAVTPSYLKSVRLEAMRQELRPMPGVVPKTKELSGPGVNAA